MATIVLRKKKKKENKIKINLSGPLLDKMLRYSCSFEKEITQGNIINMRKLWDMMDIKSYERDYLKHAKVCFIGRILDKRVSRKIEDRILLLESAKSKRFEDVEEEIIDDVLGEDDYMSPKDIQTINRLIKEKLQYGFIFTHKKELEKLFLKLDEGDYDSIEEMKESFSSSCSALLSDIKKADRLNEAGKIFSLVSDVFTSSVERTSNKIRSSANTLLTRVQWLNEMLDGGFATGRVYLFLGLSGEINCPL